jgi:hypothetical protein
MVMNGIPKDEVVALIAGLGGRVVDVEEDYAGGREWESFRYYVAKP